MPTNIDKVYLKTFLIDSSFTRYEASRASIKAITALRPIPTRRQRRAPRPRSFTQFASFAPEVEMAALCLRTSELFLLLFLIISTCAVAPPWIFSVKQYTKTCDVNKCVFDVDVNARNVDEWSLTFEPASEEKCGSLFVNKVFENVLVELPNDGRRVYFCVKSDGLWHHKGEGVFLESNDVTGPNDIEL